MNSDTTTKTTVVLRVLKKHIRPDVKWAHSTISCPVAERTKYSKYVRSGGPKNLYFDF